MLNRSNLFALAPPTSAYTKLRQRIADISSRPSTNIYLLTGYAALLTGLSVFLSLSRSGIVCLGVALAGFALVVAAKQPDRGRHLTIVSLAVAILISVGWFGWEPIVERFERIFDTGYVAEEGRAIIWKDTLGIIADFPATGSGFGTYRDLYPHYRTPHTETLTTHAHGDYLELAAEGGLAGLALAAWFWAAVMAASWRAFAGRRDPESVTLFAGAFTGILAILLHSVTDFNLQIGANGLYFFFLAGLLVSAAHTRFKVRRPVTYLARVRIRPAVWIGAGGLLLAANLAFGVGGLLGQLYFSGFKEYRYTGTPPEDTLVRIRRMASRGTVVDPLGATHFVSLGDTEQLLGNAAAALDAYTAAVRRAPCLPLNLQRLAGSLSESGNREAADRLFRAGIDRDPSRPDGYRRHAEWLLAGGERARGIEALSEALQREPRLDRKRFDEYLVVMIRRGLDVAQMRRAIPQQVRPTIYLAEFLEATDRPEAAGEVFQQALALARTDAGAGASDFQRMRKFYAAKGRDEDALRVLVAACEALPEDIGLRMALGDLYRKLGIEYRAREEYEQVLILDPDYRAAKQRLGME